MIRALLVVVAICGIGCEEGGGAGSGADASPGAAQTCAQMCAQADSAGSPEGMCAANEFQSRGYDLTQAPIECAAVAGNEAGCNACMQSISATDADCAAVAAMCL